MGLGKILLILFVAIVFYKSCSGPTTSPRSANAASNEATPADIRFKGWSYDTSDDAMSGTKTKVAALESVDGLSLEFPYAGRNQPRLTLRSKGNSLDVMVTIDKGQILCPLRECSISVKFDDDKATKFAGSGPADHSTTVVFLSPEKRFIDRLKKSKKVLVEVNLFRQGTRILEFNTAGLDWPRK